MGPVYLFPEQIANSPPKTKILARSAMTSKQLPLLLHFFTDNTLFGKTGLHSKMGAEIVSNQLFQTATFFNRGQLAP